MLNRLLLPLLAGVMLWPVWGQAQAVAVDAASLLQRLERIERRLTILEGRGFSGSGSGVNTGADVEVRLQDLEREGSTLTGGVERLGMALERLAKRLDNLSKDYDLRLRDLETAPRAAGAQAGAGSVLTSASGAAVAGVVVAGSAPAAPTVGATVGQVPPVPTEIAPDKLYNQAYAYITGAQYDAAAAWLTEFIKRHPQDKLADNAYYWLGEVQLVQNKPQAAAKSFRDGLKAFPQGAKAPANWFKLGLALQQLKQDAMAKGAWENLVKNFPKAPEADKAREKLAEIGRPTPAAPAAAPKP